MTDLREVERQRQERLRHARRILVVAPDQTVASDRRLFEKCLDLAASGHDVTVICRRARRNDAEARIQASGVQIEELPRGGKGPTGSQLTSLWHVRRRARELASLRPFDAVHLTTRSVGMMLAVESLRSSGARLVLDPPDFPPVQVESSLRGLGRETFDALQRRWKRLPYRCADAVFVTDERRRGTVIGLGRLSFDQVHVVPDADRDRFGVAYEQVFLLPTRGSRMENKQGGRRQLAHAIAWLRHSLHGRGVRRTLEAGLRFPAEVSFDKRYGVSTLGRESLLSKDVVGTNQQFGVAYKPVYSHGFRGAMRHFDLPKQGTFVDLGAGKGRAMLLALESGFESAVGVEFVKEYCTVAADNLVSFQRHAQRPLSARVIHGDVVDYAIQPEDRVFFVYNSFTAPVMQSVLDNIERSLQAAPRPLYFVYANPTEDLGRLRPGWRLVDSYLDSSVGTIALYRPEGQVEQATL